MMLKFDLSRLELTWVQPFSREFESRAPTFADWLRGGGKTPGAARGRSIPLCVLEGDGRTVCSTV